ncbi:PDZ domain-containing protein [Aquimarina megaterium]|uniref:PDZ domain-containing protein n=1 Tax=Aquimarina megaterium TaxID=1443666 RepID=UPI00046F0392|nr:PDZ domain-containing protein [Aquimarina megaterium]
MRKIILTIVLLLSISFNYAQSAKEQLRLVNSVKLEDTGFFQEIDFQDKFGYLIIPVIIGNDIYEYIFDTGGYNTLTSKIMNKNKLPNLMEVETGSSNQIKSKITLTKIPSVTIGGIDFKEIGAFNFDFEKSPQINCYTNGGLIGKSIIKEAIWQINEQTKKIILTDNLDNLKNLKGAIKVKVKLDKLFNPFIKVKVNGEMKSFLLDFGYGGFISLTEKEGVHLESKEIIEIVGEGNVSANGILNESMFIKNIENLKIGQFEIPNQLAYYSKSNNFNLIGTGLTKHFIVTLNFKQKELYLKPIQKTEKVKSEKSFGFDLNKNKNNIYVSKIFKNLSADKAGLKLNDIVVSINGKKLNGESYCDFYDFTRELLNKNQTIILLIKRKNKTHSIEIIKSDIIITE